MTTIARPNAATAVGLPDRLLALLPGIGLCLTVTGTAYALEAGERAVAGKAWLEALVLAILIGTAIRSLWTPGDRWRDGIAFSANTCWKSQVVCSGFRQCRHHPGRRCAIARRHRRRGGQCDPAELRHRAPARPADADGAAGRVRQLDLRQLGHRARWHR